MDETDPKKLAYSRTYHDRHKDDPGYKERRNKYGQKYYLEHIEQERSYAKKYNPVYYLNHKEETKKRVYKWIEENREKHNAKCMRYLARNKERNLFWLKEYLGSLACVKCGYDRYWGAMDWHHINPEQKEKYNDSMGRWIYRSLKWFKNKVIKTNGLLLCNVCHSELHGGLWKMKDLIKEVA